MVMAHRLDVSNLSSMTIPSGWSLGDDGMHYHNLRADDEDRQRIFARKSALWIDALPIFTITTNQPNIRLPKVSLDNACPNVDHVTTRQRWIPHSLRAS